ncbi:MAG: peptidase M13 [Acidobacteriota bacterium]|nr:peptidase M13 [Acidobacteriota bacterium]
MTPTPLPAGISLEDLSPEVRPADDLFRHVNGAWLDRTPIPADRAWYGSTIMLRDEAEKAVRDILEEARGAAPGTEARKIGDLYASFMDDEAVERLGAQPLAHPLGLVAGVDSIPSLLSAVGAMQRRGLGGLYQLFVDTDPGDPSRYLVFFEQAGIGLPDESYFRDEGFAEVRAAYRAHIERMLGLAGLDDAPARAQRVFDLETEIAARHWDNVESRDAVKTYNPVAWGASADLVGPAASAALSAWSRAFDAPPAALGEVVVRQPSFVRGLGELLVEGRLDAWRDWLAWQVVHALAPYLSSAFVEENFDFYGRALTGTEQLRDRWKRAVSFVEAAMGEAIGRVYVERHFPPAAKERMDELVANLIEAYRRSIADLAWMGPETRQRALEKLAAFTPKIGYPRRWRDYGALEVDAGDLIGNVRAASEFELNRNLAKIGAPIDRDEWFMTPQTVNAYYNPGMNEIVFPAAFLQPPNFDLGADDAANYGAVGCVIGHEIGHGFDDQGSRYDGSGRLADWWQASDRAAFEERTRALIAQYDVLSPREAPDRHVNGALTVGENIGDLGGVTIAWKAYQIALGGAEAPVIEGLSGAQRFFLAYAGTWRTKWRPEMIELLMASDPHAPDEFRVNQIVRNVDQFYEAFSVGPDDGLWLDPAERVSIW